MVMNRFFCMIWVVAIGLRMNAQGIGDNTHTLIFTEVCVANIDQTIDYSNNYGGWVELYNPTKKVISLNGWYVSDDAEMLTKHQLSGYTVLFPGCYQCIFFDHNAEDGEYGPEASKQVRFKFLLRTALLNFQIRSNF